MPHPANSPTAADIEALAWLAFQDIPEALRAEVGDVVFRVEEFPDRETMEELDLDSPFDLLGLYRGIDLLNKSVLDGVPEIDMIFLYRRPLLAYGEETGESFETLVRHVLIHEIGHHFGFSDDDMEALEASGE
jgi:predicted Zn-dependent protease with MMP-like domain